MRTSAPRIFVGTAEVSGGSCKDGCAKGERTDHNAIQRNQTTKVQRSEPM